MVMLVSAFGIVLSLFYVYFNVIFVWFATLDHARNNLIFLIVGDFSVSV